MDPSSGSDDGAAVTPASEIESFQLRSYQAEMVEASMKANIIVVMDTGSGKTHIAIERTRAELEMCQPDKLVWFLAPTVTLCEQQHDVFQSNLPGFGYQLLCRRDDIESWTRQSDWDAVLHNVRIVLSTHQVLLDALTHGFVKMSRLALLIFDEAHHCTLKHPAHKIMSNFYIPETENGGITLPKVLGLSASPVMTAKATTHDLQQIEQNLCATVKTPKLHRSELIRYVHRPELSQITYSLEPPESLHSPLLDALERVYVSYELTTDPYVAALLEQHRKGCAVSKQLDKLWINRKTYCNEQLRTLVSKAKAMAAELGTSAMEYYLHQCVAKFETLVRIADQQLLDISANEKQHLLKLLRGLPFSNPAPKPSTILDSLSQKTHVLIDTLVAEANNNPEFTGLVFVEQRVWVAALAEILSNHPRTKNLLRIGTFVGTSQSTKRKANISSLAEPKNQQTTLEDFRAGTMNLILATTVLEEGIDVSGCHLVVCFERPKNLKSFVQRRGRARKQQSKYFIFTPEAGAGRSSESWQALEAQMRRAYEDDMRRVKAAEENEQNEEDGERYFRVSSTGALLTLENASQHLYHFCARLSSGQTYANTRPQFEFTEAQGRITAKVVLPISVDPTVRNATTLESWRTKRMAQNDAAFEAYKTLHTAGLVNDNLLPVQEEENHEAAQYQIPDNRPSTVPISPTFDPWLIIAQRHQEDPHVWCRTLLEVKATGEDPLRLILLTPVVMPSTSDIVLYWNETKRYKVESSRLPGCSLSLDKVQLLRSITWKILHSVFPGQVKLGQKDFLCLLAPCDFSGAMMNDTQLCEWHAATEGQRPASERLTQNQPDLVDWGLVTLQGDLRKFMPKDINVLRNQAPQALDEIQIQAVRLPKRRDFLHPVLETGNENDAYIRTESVSASTCSVDNLPTFYSIFALLFPSILHRLEIYMVADVFRTTHLKPVSFDTQSLPVIITALTSSATGEDDNYQRLEFLGDCILKFITSVHLMAVNLRMPEGMLTGKKGRLVSNGYLARAALSAGLERFIFYKRFTGAKWKPRYVSQVLASGPPPAKQQKSSKVVADIIESMIGASYIVGGFPKAFACIQTLLPLEVWTPIPDANVVLYNAAPTQDTVTSLPIVEALTGHTFTKKALLLEALTHSSFHGVNVAMSYERSEFMGDAVLDYIVSKRLYAHKPELSHRTMHGIRTAMVNASFLTFRMLETTVTEDLTSKETLRSEGYQRALWQFIRSESPELIHCRDVALRQHADARVQISEALTHDGRFPWHLLSLTDPPKFLSDVVESVIGAIYIDTHGDISACEVFVRRLGILSILERILRDSVDCLHPKERLGHLAVEKDVKYVCVKGEQATTPEGKKLYRCQVKVGGKDVGGVVEGVKKLNAETIAAWRAVRVLENGGADDVVTTDSMEEGATEEEEDVFFDAEEGGGVMLTDL